jgi:[protein-PII] uridylyltransferase
MRFFLKPNVTSKLPVTAKHNDTEYNLEPDLKNAPGGLRDIQTIVWVTKRHFQTTNLYDLVTMAF